MRGKVKFFHERKGYGFISGDDGVDVFVHYSGIEMDGYKTLQDGAVVSYEVADGQRGPKAVNVRAERG